MKYDKCILTDDSNYETVLDLGWLYPSKFVEYNHQDNHKAMLTQLRRFIKSDLVQINQSLSQDEMYREYFYRSSLNPQMVASLRDVYNSVIKIIPNPNSVLDIGASDCTLLEMFNNNHNTTTVGFDPANNLKEYAVGKCDYFINDYFTSKLSPLRLYDVIMSIAMFYDIDKPHDFIEEVRSLLASNGVWVIQMTDLAGMLDTNAFDNVVQEHLCYYSLDVLVKLMAQHNLDIFKVDYNDVNGSSIRIYVCHHGAKHIEDSVKMALAYEDKVFKEKPISKFNDRIQSIKKKVVDYIRSKTAGKVFALGASTKGNTLLQVFRLTALDVPYALEINNIKFNKYTLGSGLRIISEEEGLAHKPEALLVLPWHFFRAVPAKYQQLVNDGVELIVPMPEPHIISKQGKRML